MKEALCLSCKLGTREISNVVQGRHSGSHAIAWAAILISVLRVFSGPLT